jgi:DNA-binding transcriptional LysR family regulator
MDLWQLHIFCKVVQLKSFSKAGKDIHLSQPTVSSHIRDLEEHFGCRLIDRLAREAVPTKAGELLYSYARELIALRDETEMALAEFQGKMEGHLIIGGSTIPGVHILPKIIGDFVREYPDITITLIIGDTEKIIGDTLSSDVELGIVGAKTEDKKISQEKLIEDNMRLVIPEGHKWAGKKQIPLDSLIREPFIIRESGSGTLKSVQRSLRQAGYHIKDLKIAAEMGSTEAVIQGIRHNIGISILSTIAVSEELRTGTLRALSIRGMNLKRSFYLTRYKYRTVSPLCQVFIKFLKRSCLTSG